ncbi:MAG: CBS domain-containing protein [Thermoplasmata archaeon]
MKKNMIYAKDVMTKNVITIDEDETLASAISTMTRNNIHELPVLSGKNYIGMISMDKIFKRKNLPLYGKVKNFIENVPKINPKNTYSEIAEMLILSGYRGLPVIDDNNKVVGLISRSDLLKYIDSMEDISSIKISQLYVPNPRAVKEDDNILHAINYMKELEERSLPVIDKKNRLVGVISLTDIMNVLAKEKQETKGKKDFLSNPKYFDIKISSLMTPSPITISESSTVKEASQKMVGNDISTLFIVNKNEELVAVISEYDIVSMLAKSSKEEGSGIQVIISGSVESEVYNGIYEIVEKSLKRMSKFMRENNPRLLSIHVNKFSSNENYPVYDVQSKLSLVNKGYYGTFKGWNIYKGVDESLREIEEQIRKEKEKSVSSKKIGGKFKR